ncbi:crossover junction endodeoxyribonuclease RuvC [Patescibacteria group bacterium]|nr:crossover junction endodeoxyribonuclease RuvC [Patescibacteria group bacterium]MBU1612864.1 crossover junction endodeoxyribonuclease RuvC [Patescibacteria group bacterium]
MVILGIDPGFGRIGYGIIEKSGVKEWKAVDYGCIETPLENDFVDRLSEIYSTLNHLIKKHKPARMAVEELFFFKNVKTAIKVGQARGVILLAGVENGLEIDEFTPLQVKQAVTGYGRAEKKQMQKMVAVILGIKKKIKSDDAADALAVALCAGQSLWVKRVARGV